MRAASGKGSFLRSVPDEAQGEELAEGEAGCAGRQGKRGGGERVEGCAFLLPETPFPVCRSPKLPDFRS